jgi:glycosyltransferase involved in cell wall biosynthesis
MVRPAMLAPSISCILPAQDTVQLTLETLSQVRDQTRGLRAEIVLVDRPSLLDLCREIPADVLLVRTERRLPLPRLLYSGILASRGDITVWCPRPGPLPAGDLAGSIDFVSRHDSLVLAPRRGAADRPRTSAAGSFNGLEIAERFRSVSALASPALRLCPEWFVSRRATARGVAWRLSTRGDLPILTAILLKAMRLPIIVDHGLTPPDRASSPVRIATPEVARHAPATGGPAPCRRPDTPLVSVVITAHNEGPEVRRTIESVQANTSVPVEIIVVDDGSTDGCCENLEGRRVRVIRHDRRVGVAYSRNVGARDCRGDVLVFLDGHQRVSSGCLDRCAAVALSRGAIVWPDVRALHNRTAVAHGAFFRLAGEGNPLTATWNNQRPGQPISKITSLRAPGYFVPRSLFDNLRWVSQLRGWGGSEAAIALKAFFLGIDILHVCGPVARHLFRPKFGYAVRNEEVSRNHALITRVCFDDRTWFEHWLPHVFQGHLSPEAARELAAPDVVAEHKEFMKLKRRPDREFWRGLLRRKEPEGLWSPPTVVTLPSALARGES